MSKPLVALCTAWINYEKVETPAQFTLLSEMRRWKTPALSTKRGYWVLLEKCSTLPTNHNTPHVILSPKIPTQKSWIPQYLPITTHYHIALLQEHCVIFPLYGLRKWHRGSASGGNTLLSGGAHLWGQINTSKEKLVLLRISISWMWLVWDCD